MGAFPAMSSRYLLVNSSSRRRQPACRRPCCRIGARPCATSSRTACRACRGPCRRLGFGREARFLPLSGGTSMVLMLVSKFVARFQLILTPWRDACAMRPRITLEDANDPARRCRAIGASGRCLAAPSARRAGPAPRAAAGRPLQSRREDANVPPATSRNVCPWPTTATTIGNSGW